MEAYIDYKPGYVDSAAVVNPSKPTYSAYAPPSPKKKKKVERTRYRQKTYGSAPKTQQASVPAPSTAPAPPPNVPSLAEAPGAATASTTGSASPTAAEPTTGQVGAPGTKAEDQVGVANPEQAGSSSSQAPASQSSSAAPPANNAQVASAATQKPGKKEKIRFGQAPTKTLPAAATTQTVDAGATGASVDSSNAQNAAGETQLAANGGGDASPIGATASSVPEKKTRYSDRLKLPKEKKAKVPKVDPFAPPPVSAQEVADRQTQSAPLGLSGDSNAKTKKPKPTEKTRLQDQPKNKASAPATDDANLPAPTPPPDTQPAPPAAPK